MPDTITDDPTPFSSPHPQPPTDTDRPLPATTTPTLLDLTAALFTGQWHTAVALIKTRREVTAHARWIALFVAVVGGVVLQLPHYNITSNPYRPENYPAEDTPIFMYVFYALITIAGFFLVVVIRSLVMKLLFKITGCAMPYLRGFRTNSAALYVWAIAVSPAITTLIIAAAFGFNAVLALAIAAAIFFTAVVLSEFVYVGTLTEQHSHKGAFVTLYVLAVCLTLTVPYILGVFAEVMITHDINTY
ncbi:hypothetical protein [Timonella sp. A28]|uniref:hypothetical protein n=1 Tax=Timonella sp. A28 TaxID=3442640 RepID=UPI003EB8251B